MINAGDARDHRAVVARPFEGRNARHEHSGRHCAALGRSRLMDLDAIELILHPGVVGTGGQAAGTGRRSRRRSGRQ